VLIPELLALARQGLTLGVVGLRWASWPELERAQPDAPRLLAYPAGIPSEEEVEAVRAARVDLAFTTLAGTNDLRWTDLLRLRSIPIDSQSSLEAFRTRLAMSSPRWNRLGGWVEPATAEERRFVRVARARRRRLRFVHRPLDAVLTASLWPRRPFFGTLRAAARWRSSNHERLRNLSCLAMRTVPPLERWLQGALLDSAHLPFPVEGIELEGYGSAATVFRLELGRGRPPHVLKVYRWTLGQPATLLLQVARRQRARYEQLRLWFGESVLRTHFLLLRGPLRGLPVSASLQERIEPSSDLLAPADEALLRTLRSEAGLAPEFAAFARRVLAVREQGYFPDVLGPGNLLLVRNGAGARIRLIDCDGLYDLRCRCPGLPHEWLDASARRFERLLSALEGRL
jgi:hypothetical protein